MRIIYFITLLLLFIQETNICQDFNISKTGDQTFNFKDPHNRNQASFTSKALLETFTGITTDVLGEISFDPADIKNSIKGEIFVSANSINTGLEMRDEALKGSGWLNAKEYPYISFRIKKVDEVVILDDNKLQLSLVGVFNCHGKSKDIMMKANLILLEESNMTKKRMPGDLLSVETEFSINLSDYGIHDMFIPTRVAEKININVNIVGTDIKPE